MAFERLVFIGFVIVSVIFVISAWYNIVQNIFKETTACINLAGYIPCCISNPLICGFNLLSYAMERHVHTKRYNIELAEV